MWLQLDVIGIDEAQFFEDLYDFCRNAADHDGKTVIVAGLDGDYLRYHFSLSHPCPNVSEVPTPMNLFSPLKWPCFSP